MPVKDFFEQPLKNTIEIAAIKVIKNILRIHFPSFASSASNSRRLGLISRGLPQ
jgi:hypothetical protein